LARSSAEAIDVAATTASTAPSPTAANSSATRHVHSSCLPSSGQSVPRGGGSSATGTLSSR
jgi:hypothetical protein